MKDTKIYIVTLIASLLFVATAIIWPGCPTTTILSGIGCSGIAAAIMAIFLERSSNAREEEQRKRATNLYFREMNSQLTMLIEKLIWLEERLADEHFKWDYPTETYNTFRYMIAASRMGKDRTITFDEAEKILEDIGHKYDLEGIKKLTVEEKQHVEKMFEIVSNGAKYLLNETIALKRDQLTLNAEGYASIEDTKDTIYYISTFLEIAAAKDYNYKIAVDSLLHAVKRIRKIGEFTNNINVGMHGTINLME